MARTGRLLTLLARVTSAAVLTQPLSSAILAPPAFAAVLAYPLAPALLARVASAAVLALLGTYPHSLHALRWRPCSHIDDPPHSLHLLRRWPCSHIDDPPHSLHFAFCPACLQWRCHFFAPTRRRLNPPSSSGTSSYSPPPPAAAAVLSCLRLVEGILALYQGGTQGRLIGCDAQQKRGCVYCAVGSLFVSGSTLTLRARGIANFKSMHASEKHAVRRASALSVDSRTATQAPRDLLEYVGLTPAFIEAELQLRRFSQHN